MTNKMYNYYLLVLLLIALHSCVQNQSIEDSSFRIPYVLKDTLENSCDLIRAHSIVQSRAKFIRKDKVLDILDLTVKMDSSMSSDLLYESYYEALDSLSLDGLEIYTDYQNSIPTRRFDFEKTSSCYYPVYVVNQTPITKLFMGKNDYVFAIQEAQDGEGRWRPIEHGYFDFCGNGKWGLKIHAGEFVTIFFPKYEGGYHTKMRVRIENRDVIYVSKAFDGIVNTPQFYFDTTKGDFLKSYFKQSPEALQFFFHGSIPFEFGEHE